MKKLYSFLFLSFFTILFSQTSYTTNFHDTKGNVNVNDGGQLEFSLPISVPKGIKDVSPNVSLMYVSNSGNGIAGYGWNITGITAIKRMGKTIEKDGELTSVQLNNTDYYTFNGQRLILKSGTYGGDGAEYVTEKYSNIKIKSIGTQSGLFINGLQGPGYWQVTFEDGSQAWYGSLEGNEFTARTPTEYNIVKWRDNQGNYILYNYAPNIFLWTTNISSIQWGGNDITNKPSINEISFDYVDRSINEENYLSGARFSQTRLLKTITVKTNGLQFKKYEISHVNNSTNYEFVSKITEFNSNNEAANPVTFTYPTFTPSSVKYDGVLSNNPDSFDDIRLTGDLNGDSYLDFIMNNGVVKLGAFDDAAYSEISTNKVFSSTAQLVSTLIDEQGEIYNGNGIVDYENGKIVGYIFRNNAFVKVFEKQVYDNIICNGCAATAKIQEADIDGDGISNIITKLTINCPDHVEPCDPNDPTKPCLDPNKNNSSTNKPPIDEPLECAEGVSTFIVDLKNSNLPIILLTTDAGVNSANTSNEKYLDVDGDGKVESINVSNSAYTVFEFVKIGNNIYNKKIRFSNNLVETKDPEFPILYGDFNGDGNLDFTIPTTNTQAQDNWRFYMGTEKGFIDNLNINFLKFRKPNQDTTWSLIHNNFYSVSDINKDGKSDIITIYSKNNVGQVDNSGNAIWRSLQYDVKTLLSIGGNYFTNGYSSSSPSWSVPGGEYGLFSPITFPIKNVNNYYDVFVFKKTRVHKYKSQTPLGELSRISAIDQAGLKTIVIYKELKPSSIFFPNAFYTKKKMEVYPFFSFKSAEQTYAVSRLQQGSKKQDFVYEGMTGHFIGRGMLGFLRSARSTWYADGFENTKIWSGREIDTHNYGLPVKEWTIKTTSEFSAIPNDISLTNTSLLSLKISEYSHQQLANGIEVNLPKKITEKDFLKNNTTISSITYGNYYLPEFTEVNINNNFAKKTSEMHYIHNANGVGNNYFIGRPDWKEDIVYAYNDIVKSKESYTYNNNLLKTVTKFNNDNSGWIKESYDYDNGLNDVGNITRKTISNSIDSNIAVEENFYDPTSRFVITSKNNLEQETHFSHDNWGNILTQTDLFGNTVTNSYDGWGKLQSSVNSLSGSKTFSYEKFNSGGVLGIKVTEDLPDGNKIVQFSNLLGQNYKTVTKSFNNNTFLVKESAYDILGRKIAESEPYEVTSINPSTTSVSSSTWNISTYDDSVFPTKITATAFNGGKVLETTVSGNTATIKELNGYGRTTTKTTDALGNVISSSDTGGMIIFTYNASGQNLTASFQGNTVTTTYDEWGRKASFHDPANGMYEYRYNGSGNIHKILSPKGKKEYYYLSNGLLSQVQESSSDGVSTNKTFSLEYDGTSWNVIKKIGESNGRYFEQNFNYDQYGRLISNNEIFENKEFYTNDRTFDSFGRLITYKKGIISNGVTTESYIENRYKDWEGSLFQIIDKNDSLKPILWSLNTTNAKGQMLSGSLGKARVNNTYDDYGFLTNTDRYYFPTLQGYPSQSFVNINYSFDAIKNELNSRTYQAVFGIDESFIYDGNNRLTQWTNPVSGQMSSNSYDNKGRITLNDQVGDIEFNGGNSIYQATNIQLNAAGEQLYDMNGVSKLLQMISYNENNDPIRIDGTEFDYEFRYGLSNARQIMTYGQQFSEGKEGKYVKYYSEGNDFEILYDTKTGEEKHVIYIEGSPYESEIIYVKPFKDDARYNFLHKDYLGSILAITDFNKNILEQRHYDAWGNFTHLIVDGNQYTGEVLKDFLKELTDSKGGLIVDRGYTSHEHLYGVELIHMNGRLYDSQLHRFLNADENIQDTYNTQNYNKYGYVINNPMIYSDPSGEFIWFVVGAVIGAYITGSSANGTFNPFKWDWKNTWGKIALGAFFGALSGGVGAMAGSSAAVFAASNLGIQGGVLGGAIAGLAGGAVGGAIGGLGNAIIFGESIGRSIVRGLVAGAIGGAVLGGIAGGIQQGIANAKPGAIKGNIWSGAKVAEGRSAWALNNTAKVADVQKAIRIEAGIPEGIGIEGNGDGNLKLQDLGDGVKITPKPNDILGQVDEFKLSDKALIGELKISNQDFNSLYSGYSNSGTPIYDKAGLLKGYSFEYGGIYKGSIYPSTTMNGIPTMRIENINTGHIFKVRFTIKP